jgi:hypothetical protein
MNKSEIITGLKSALNDFEQTLHGIDEKDFFASENDKWSVAENVRHLILSAKPVNMAMGLPKFIFLYFGKPNRPLMDYDGVVAKYQAKLKAGGKAMGPYVPKKITVSKAELIADFRNMHDKLLKKIENWSETDLNKYLLPHPLIGRMMMREMLYFTLYHIRHHHKTIKSHE